MSDNWKPINDEDVPAYLRGKTIDDATLTVRDNYDTELILKFTDGSTVTISGVHHTDSTGGLDFIEETT